MDRRRNLLTLIARHLLDSGYVESAERLQTESSISLGKLDVADNIDLLYILGVRRLLTSNCAAARLLPAPGGFCLKSLVALLFFLHAILCRPCGTSRAGV